MTEMSRKNWDDLTHEVRNMLQCSAQYIKESSKRCKRIDELLIRLSTEKRMLDWLPPVANPKIRIDKMGNGYFGSPRGERLHHGTDYLVQPGDPIFMTLKNAKIIREVRPYSDHPELSGIVVANLICINIIFYVEPLMSLIGEEVAQSQLIGYAQDVRLKYGHNMLPHVHSEKYII